MPSKDEQYIFMYSRLIELITAEFRQLTNTFAAFSSIVIIELGIIFYHV